VQHDAQHGALDLEQALRNARARELLVPAAMLLRASCRVLSIAIVLFVARVARAGETAAPSGFYGEVFTGVRTVRPDNIALEVPTGASAEPSLIRVDAREVSPGVAGVLGGGGGFAFGPVLLGVELSVGLGGNARAPARLAGDITVKPTGFVALFNAASYAGVMLERKDVRYRLDGVLGWELVGLGMERPGYPDTVVSAVNGTRWTLGPRVRADFLLTEMGSLGIALGCDARAPLTNATLTFVVTTL
jgi:hypothetical protein